MIHSSSYGLWGVDVLLKGEKIVENLKILKEESKIEGKKVSKVVQLPKGLTDGQNLYRILTLPYCIYFVLNPI